MQFNALVEEWPGTSIVFFRELPGCFASGATTEAALQATPAAIEQYFRWLKANDLSIVEEDIHPVNVVLAEKSKSREQASGPLFAADQAAPNEQEINNALNIAATLRALVIEIVANAPAHSLEQPVSPGEWSLLQHLQHIAKQENWYISRLQEHPAAQPGVTELSADDLTMKIFEDAMDNEIILRDLTQEQCTGTFSHENEEWTAAKVLRRQTAHLYEHFLQMTGIESRITALR